MTSIFSGRERPRGLVLIIVFCIFFILQNDYRESIAIQERISVSAVFEFSVPPKKKKKNLIVFALKDKAGIFDLFYYYQQIPQTDLNQQGITSTDCEAPARCSICLCAIELAVIQKLLKTQRKEPDWCIG